MAALVKVCRRCRQRFYSGWDRPRSVCGICEPIEAPSPPAPPSIPPGLTCTDCGALLPPGHRYTCEACTELLIKER